MNPQHKNPTRKERTASAPYNFVPLPERVIAFRNQPGSIIAMDQSVYHDDRYTGWLDVELETLSPVYVRAGLSPERYAIMERQEKDSNDKTPHLDKERNRPEFFHTGDPDVPVIPGSSLRGMIRALCEIIGHGKLSPVSDQALVYRAVGDRSSHGRAYRLELMEEQGSQTRLAPKMLAGYIRKQADGWYIQPAENLNPADPSSPTHARLNDWDLPANKPANWQGYKEAFEIYVQCGPDRFESVNNNRVEIKRVTVTSASEVMKPGLRKAVLARTGPAPRKHSDAVIFPPASVPKSDWIRIPDGTRVGEPDLVAAYLDQVTKTGKSNQHELLGSPDGVLRDYYPVMYVMKGGKLRFFGHTQMFRMPYRYSPQGLLPDEHKDPGTLDLAQAMFGTVRDQRSGAAGRVFVEDARLHPKQDEGRLWLEDNPVVMPKILGGPKPTTFQHYLTQPEPDSEYGRGLKTYNDVGQTTLRGHKLYWHKPKNLARGAFEERPLDETQKGKDKQHTYMKPVRDGVRFRFRVRFENLLPEELGLLWWAVKLPAKGEFAHKIGMGKPLGLGSVRLTPVLTVIEPADRYSSFLDATSHGLQVGRVTVSGDDAAQAFEKLAARALKLPAGASFAETPRMRALLEMLRWPGPPAEETRYMSIGIDEETNKITGTNEFKERPVLPDPLGVARNR